MTHEYTCPKCGEHDFTITITQDAEVDFRSDGDHHVDDISGDAEWDSKSHAECKSCNHSGLLGLMKTEDVPNRTYLELDQLLDMATGRMDWLQLLQHVRTCSDTALERGFLSQEEWDKLVRRSAQIQDAAIDRAEAES